jgi:4-hydroxybenzoate polyprenyltransferase
MNVEAQVLTRPARFKAVVRAMRPHQWAKNVLLFVPSLTAHRINDAGVLTDAVLAFLAFSLCASSVYVLNDLHDLKADRAHPRKRRRPFAAGDLPVGVGFVLIPLLLSAAAAVAAFLPRDFQLALAGYYLVTVLYSFVFKGMVLVDTMALAGLYTLRIFAGAAAIGVPLSFWLLLFSVFLFLSLAFVKRYAELEALKRSTSASGEVRARGYWGADLAMLENLGIASGYMSVVVLALYINSAAVASLYRRPQAIWLLVVMLLYWISRIWMKTHRGRMHDDPVIFALRDRVSLLLGLIAALTVVIAI